MHVNQDNNPLVVTKEALNSLSHELSNLMVHLEELEKTYEPRVTRNVRASIEDAQNQQSVIFNELIQAEWTQESAPDNALRVVEDSAEKASILQDIVDHAKEDISIIASSGEQYDHVYAQALAMIEELRQSNGAKSYDYSRVAKFSTDLQAIDRIKNREPVQSVHNVNELIARMHDFQIELDAQKALYNAIIERKKQLSSTITFSTGINSLTVVKMKAQISSVRDTSGKEGMLILDSIEKRWEEITREKSVKLNTKDADKLLSQLRLQKKVRTKEQVFTINDIKFLDNPVNNSIRKVRK